MKFCNYQDTCTCIMKNIVAIWTLQATKVGAQWLMISGRVLDSRSKGCGFEPCQYHSVVSFSNVH